MTKKQRAEKVIEILKQLYPNPKCSLVFSNPLEMLIATQLSAQCTDARVNIVTKELFKKYRSVYDYANADYDELIEYIKSAGFYKNKAKNIIACCKRIIDVYGGEVPSTMEDLTSLAGTGRKTANLVLGEIFGKSAVVIDTHNIRLINRIGLANETNPVKLEFEMKKLIPENEQLNLCHRFVYHGREVCAARKPKCDICALAEVCKSYGKFTEKIV